MPARAKSAPSSWVARANSGRKPFGSATGTGSGNWPVSSASKAARAAPAGAGAGRPAALERRRPFRLGHARWPSARDRVCLEGSPDDPRAHDRRASLRQRQDDGDARPSARVQAPRRRRRRPQVRPRLYRPGLPCRSVGAGGRQSQFLGHGAQASGRARRAGGGTKRACSVRSLDGTVRRRSGEAGRTGASADVAAALGMPVLLVIDVTGQAQSAAAIVKGCAIL